MALNERLIRDEVDNYDPVDAKICLRTVLAVGTSWDKVKKIPDVEVVAGELLFRNIFELAPGAWKMFGFGKNFEIFNDELFNSREFRRHSKGVITMLDTAIQMLGPDIDPLSEALLDLGARHVDYGVMPAHYPIVGEALLKTLEVALSKDFTPAVKQLWSDVFVFVAAKMKYGASAYLKQKLKAYEDANHD